MNITEYLACTRRTAGELTRNKLFLVTCLYEEVGEVMSLMRKSIYYNKPVDPEKMKEEIGDAMWALVQLFAMNHPTALDVIHLGYRTPNSLDSDTVLLSDLHTTTLEALTGSWRQLGSLVLALGTIAARHGFTLEEACIANDEKLRRRYPDGYSHEAAAKRADKEV